MRTHVPRLAPALLSLIGLAVPASAQVDVDLILLEAGVNATNAVLQVADGELAVAIAMKQASDDAVLEEFAMLADARERELELVLLECATSPAPCIPPSWLVSARTEECKKPILPDPDPHKHTIGFPCPLREIVEILAEDIQAAQNQGLDRDYDAAIAHREAAIAATLAGDGRTAFEESCASFRALACR